MKKLLLFLFLLVSILSYGQETTTFILVRHAEKVADGTKNPALTEAGIMRANKLLELFESADISAIYSTDFDRTQMTVAPLATAMDMNILSYGWNDPKGLLSELLSKHSGGTIVISGHSNTTPVLANLLLGKQRLEQFDDADHSNILVVTTSELGKGKLLHLRF